MPKQKMNRKLKLNPKPKPGIRVRPGARTMTFKLELSLSPALMAVLTRCQPGGSGGSGGTVDNSLLSEILKKLDTIIAKENTIMATQQQFQDKLDTINANTNRTAAAATVIGELMTGLREEVKAALENAGVPASEEEALLGKFDPIITATEQVATFLEGVAANPNTEPPPVEPPIEEPPIEEPPVEDPPPSERRR